ncbi:esterase/lipase family protein [Azospirillum canadense]|uniref:esterase/lipase family protein n=1 Tax=Azospirillum canadense TaxID=403962 RepID=UPI002226C42E|nr:alpha/beta fold hydrolase [Azospirillum canadense]MCW2240564.1 pimeloyl-ACP methyl ester carboxylesterase [Azospirillum canadense]
MQDFTIEDFLGAATPERLKLSCDDRYAAILRNYLGDAAYGEYRRLAEEKFDTAHLAFGAPKNLIFVPGVMGSLLQSRTRGGIWWIDVRTRKRIDQLGLSPDGTQDADLAIDIVPTTTDPSYDPFLAAVLEQPDFAHELFAYDWRKPLKLSTAALRDLVFKLYTENGGSPVHLVAHSMGGLMVRAALMDYGPELWPKLGRVIFIGTPHYGSPAIAGYLKNHLWGFDLMVLLGQYLSRQTLRSLWGVLGMLPAPRGIYPGTRPGDPTPWQQDRGAEVYAHPCANFDMYRVEDWKLELTPEQSTQLQKVLDGAADFHRRMHEAHQMLDQNFRDRMMVIAGVGYKTLFRLEYERRFFGVWEHAAKVTERVENDMHREGDGRVPLASTMLDNVPVRYVRGAHGGLPNIPAVYYDVFRCLREEAMRLPDNVHEALSAHLSAEAGSEAPHLDGTAMANPFTDDLGQWEPSPPSPERLGVLTAQLEDERLPEFTRVRLL